MISIGLTEILSAAGVAGIVITALWRLIMFFIKKNNENLEKCEKGHVELSSKVMQMAEDLGELRGRQDGVNGMIDLVRSELKQALLRDGND